MSQIKQSDMLNIRVSSISLYKSKANSQLLMMNVRTRKHKETSDKRKK